MQRTITLSVEEITDNRIEALARGTRRTRSAIVDLAVKLLTEQDEFAAFDPAVSPSRHPTTSGINALSSKRTALSSIPGLRKGVTA